MAATETSSASSVLSPLSPSQRILEKLNLILNKRPPAAAANNHPKPSAAVFHRKKRKCHLCSPTPTKHPGSFRCAIHRPLAKENIEILVLKRKRRRRSTSIATSKSGLNERFASLLALRPKRRRCSFTTSNSGLNLRKTALMNSLAGIGSVEAVRCRKYLKESMVKPSSLRFRRVFRPRRSRFYVLHND
ncbi:hypothetical protein N665_0050s0081 [Sinapis alba]|nr:hypothetical protein N665_0050s0081 [Sinapis alba]